MIKIRDSEDSEKNAGLCANLENSKDLVWGGGHLYRRNIHGREKKENVNAETRRLG